MLLLPLILITCIVPVFPHPRTGIYIIDPVPYLLCNTITFPIENRISTVAYPVKQECSISVSWIGRDYTSIRGAARSSNRRRFKKHRGRQQDETIDKTYNENRPPL